MSKWLAPRSKTWLHRANPAFKLAVILLFFIMTLFTHYLDFMFYQAVLFILLLFLLSGYAPWKVGVMVLSFVLVFVSSSATMILFGKGDHIWWSWGLIQISEESFFRGVHVGLKSVTFAAEGLLFVLTTSSVALFYSLMQQVKLPPKYAYSFMASIRMLPMVWEELQIRRNALRIRGFRKPRGIRGWGAQIKLYAVPLLSQSIRRAHRVAVAMEAKSFDSVKARTFYYPSTYSRYDVLMIAVFIGAVVAAFSMAQVLPPFGIADVRY